MLFSPIRSHVMAGSSPLVLAAMDINDVTLAELRDLGIDFPEVVVREMAAALDAAPDLQPTIFPGTLGAPIQFLQTMLPGVVSTLTTERTIDEILGSSTVGAWEDEEVVQGVVEPTGLAVPYTDYGNVPYASYNPGYERRTIVRFEMGFRVGELEGARASRMRMNAAARKRAAAAMALDIVRNRVGFYGYNAANQRTYGFLNDPSLPSYVTVATGAGGSTLWAQKTFLEITADIRIAVGRLIGQGGGVIKAGPNATNATKLTLVLPLGSDNFLGVTSVYGNSVGDWLNKTYPNMRVIVAPELTNANGGASVFYLFADRIEDGQSDDNGRTWENLTVVKTRLLGVQQLTKAFEEDHSNATAGALLKRPYAVVRFTGI